MRLPRVVHWPTMNGNWASSLTLFAKNPSPVSTSQIAIRQRSHWQLTLLRPCSRLCRLGFILGMTSTQCVAMTSFGVLLGPFKQANSFACKQQLTIYDGFPKGQHIVQNQGNSSSKADTIVATLPLQQRSITS